MTFSFEIADRFNNLTPIDNPIGWDATSIVLKRDRDKHGVFFDFQANTYEYTGLAAKMLRSEYELYGVEGNMTLRMNYECGDGTETLYVGRFAFAQWNDEYGDDCSVKLPVETTSDIMTFTNRMDQKVNLETLSGFDGVTVLPPYSALPFDATLPGKSIFVQNYAINETDNTTAWLGNWIDTAGTTGVPQMAFFVPEFSKTIAQEIGGFVIPPIATETIDEPMIFTWIPPISWY